MNKIKLLVQRIAVFCALGGGAFSVYAHPSPYLDFFNVKEGTKEANSGCRLVLCLAGGAQGSNCKKDVKAMYWEIAMAWKGHGWIPMCMGAPGMNFSQNGQTGLSSGRVSIEQSLIESGKPNAGKRNGVKIDNEYVTVWRYNGCGHSDDCDPYELVYMATRTPVFAPVNGVTDFERPAKMWAGKVASTDGVFLGTRYAKTPQAGHRAVSGWGLPTLATRRTTQTNSVRSGFNNNNEVQGQEGANIDEGDIDYEDVADGVLPVFDRVNLSGQSVGLYERSVLGKINPLKSSGAVQETLESTPPGQSKFKKGDIVVISQFTKGDGRDPNSYGVSANYNCDLRDKDGKVNLQNPTCTSANGAKSLNLSGLRESVVPNDPSKIDPSNTTWQSEEGVVAERMTLPAGPAMTREDANADPVLQGSQQSLGVGVDQGLDVDFSVVPDIPDPIPDVDSPQ